MSEARLVDDESLGYWRTTDDTSSRCVLTADSMSSDVLEAGFLRYAGTSVRTRCADLIGVIRLWLVMHDGSRHRDARSRLAATFSKSNVARFESAVDRIVRQQLEKVEGAAEIDAVSALSDPVSARSTATLLGIPDADPATLHEWARSLADFFSAPYREELALRAQAALHQMQELLTEGDVGIWHTLSGSDEERLATCSLLLFGGLKTTSALMSSALAAMLQTDRAPEGGVRRVPAADLVEHTLAHSPPLDHVARVASEDSQVGGAKVRQGDLVIVSLTGTDHLDPPRRPGPVEDAGRSRRHLAFGFGRHYCPGAPLSRIEAVSLLRQFDAMFPQAAVDWGRAVWGENRTYRGYGTLRVRLRPE
jgi:cytochrome P450